MTRRSLNGAAVLDEVAAFIGRYVAFPSPHCLTAVTLWPAHTHARPGTFYVTPRLVIDSAEPSSGKTRVLELLNLLVAEPEMILSPTVAAIFRMLVDGPRTLLFDETDTIFNPRNQGNYEDLRALLNAGYKRGATIPRCVGDAARMEVKRFPVFCPVALAGVAGGMPRTIITRAVPIHMRKRAPGEHVADYYEEAAEQEAKPLRKRLAAWVSTVNGDLSGARPKMPTGVVDRPAEVWKALLAVADAAGGEWPKKAQDACSYFVLDADSGELSLGVQLLRDLHNLFDKFHVDRMPSAQAVTELCKLDESPWADLYGKPLDQRRLAKELGRYGIESKPIKMPGNQTPRGYLAHGDNRNSLADAWSRHLPHAATGATGATPQVNPVADTSSVADASATDQTSATALSREVAPVAPVAPLTGPERAPVRIARTTSPRRECGECGKQSTWELLSGLCRPCFGKAAAS